MWDFYECVIVIVIVTKPENTTPSPAARTRRTETETPRRNRGGEEASVQCFSYIKGDEERHLEATWRAPDSRRHAPRNQRVHRRFAQVRAAKPWICCGLFLNRRWRTQSSGTKRNKQFHFAKQYVWMLVASRMSRRECCCLLRSCVLQTEFVSTSCPGSLVQDFILLIA